MSTEPDLDANAKKAKQQQRRKANNNAPNRPGPNAPKGKKKTPRTQPIEVAPPASKAKLQARHYLIVVLFFAVVVGPLAVWSSYLYNRAADQYVSLVGFTVQAEEIQSPLDLLGGLGSLSGGGSSDTDILYEFIQSQIMVKTIDEQLDLRSMYSKPENDPLFSFDPSGSVEDLVSYWQRMVLVNYDNATSLIEIDVRAFEADDAQKIAQAIFDESSRVINALSAISREDTTRYSLEELDKSVELLKVAREKMTQFRFKNQIADPETEIVVQTGLMNALQQRLSDALIELDLLREDASDSDPRVKYAQRKIDVIHNRISDERRKFGADAVDQTGEDFSRMIGDYEILLVERQFAEQSYLSARASYDFALAEADRKSRYLAAYIQPTLAERSVHPRRELMIGLGGLVLLMIWAIMTLILYSVRDRR